MNEDQANTMVEILVNISDTLNTINNKISTHYDLSSVCQRLDSVVKKLEEIEINTTN